MMGMISRLTSMLLLFLLKLSKKRNSISWNFAVHLLNSLYMAFSPILVRTAAGRKLVSKSTSNTKELQKMALLMEQGRMAQLNAQANPQGPQGQATPPNGNAGQQIVASQTPPTGQEIQNQLHESIGSCTVKCLPLIKEHFD